MSQHVQFNDLETNEDLEMVQDVSPKEVEAHIDQLTLIDVRSKEEYTGALGHIANSQLITLDRLMDHIDEIPQDKTVVFICRSGRRSASAAALAKDHGLESVYNLKGGMLLWNELGLKTEGKNSQ